MTPEEQKKPTPLDDFLGSVRTRVDQLKYIERTREHRFQILISQLSDIGATTRPGAKKELAYDLLTDTAAHCIAWALALQVEE